jgi:hypothetical protein
MLARPGLLALPLVNDLQACLDRFVANPASPQSTGDRNQRGMLLSVGDSAAIKRLKRPTAACLRQTAIQLP